MLALAGKTTATEPELDSLLRQFEAYCGARLVFAREELPEGKYHDILQPLRGSPRADAAAICLSEARKYPPGYFGDAGLKAVGLFAACVSKKGDGFRPFNRQLGGYRYFGNYNGFDAVAVAYYTDDQLPLTFHHEIFHHIDSTRRGENHVWHLTDDDADFEAAILGRMRYAAPILPGRDLVALRRRADGFTLRDAVSGYAAKNAREDQAETARHLMTSLPDSLVQIIDKPDLAGSQRILHVLREYERAVPHGPDVDWFVDVALGRQPPATADQMLALLQGYAAGGRSGYDGVADDPRGARRTLEAVARLEVAAVEPQQAASMVRLATEITHALLKQRIRPDLSQRQFEIWGREDAGGVNWTLRSDVRQFGIDAARLKRIATLDKQQGDLLARTQMKNLRLLARYYAYILSYWSVTPGTRQVFESARDRLSRSLPDELASLTTALQEASLIELAWRISRDGQPRLPQGYPARTRT